MYYVPWDWHVNSPRPVAALEPLLLLTNPWRLTLLFLVSGAATRFLLDGHVRQGARASRRFVGARIVRLVPPLLFGMLVIVPPQTYYELHETLQGLGVRDPSRSAWLQGFWVKYVTGSGGWCHADACLVTPTWNHLWFVAYLLVYTLIVTCLARCAGRALHRLAGTLDRVEGWRLLAGPILWLALLRLALADRFAITHALTDDWYNHAVSFSAFTFGFMTARSARLRSALVEVRWPALLIGTSAWIAWAGYAWAYRADAARPPETLQMVMDVVYAADQWAFIAAALGFGARHLNHDAPALRYLRVGVFPFYIVHQTVIIVVAHELSAFRLPRSVEASLLLAITAIGCVATYELARRLGWLGLLLGVRPQRVTRTRAGGPAAAVR